MSDDPVVALPSARKRPVPHQSFSPKSSACFFFPPKATFNIAHGGRAGVVRRGNSMTGFLGKLGVALYESKGGIGEKTSPATH